MKVEITYPVVHQIHNVTTELEIPYFFHSVKTFDNGETMERYGVILKDKSFEASKHSFPTDSPGQERGFHIWVHSHGEWDLTHAVENPCESTKVLAFFEDLKEHLENLIDQAIQ